MLKLKIEGGKKMEISRNDSDLVQAKMSSKVIGIEDMPKFEDQLARLRKAQEVGENICISYENHDIAGVEPFSVRLFSCDKFTDEEYYLLAHGLPQQIYKPLCAAMREAFLQEMDGKLTKEQFETLRQQGLDMIKNCIEFYKEERMALHSHGGWEY